MCTVVRLVAKWSGVVPWDRRRMTINIPDGLPRAATMFILRETLRLIGATQPVEPTTATCFCGEPVVLPTPQSAASGQRARSSQAVSTAEAVRHGA